MTRGSCHPFSDGFSHRRTVVAAIVNPCVLRKNEAKSMATFLFSSLASINDPKPIFLNVEYRAAVLSLEATPNF